MKSIRTLACIILTCAFCATSAMAHSPNEQRHAVTLWWIIFNSPENCVSNPGSAERCGLVDIMGQPYPDSVAAGQPDPALISPNLASGLAAVYASG